MDGVSKKEWLIGAIVILVVIGLSIIFENHNVDYIRDFQAALRINDATKFSYAEKTKIGNVLAYGNMHGNERVSFPELRHSYSYLRKVEQEYTMHTRQVAHETCSGTGSNKTCVTTYTTEIYYSWDFNGDQIKQTGSYTFLGVVFNYDQIDLPNALGLEMNDETVSDYYKKDIKGGYIYDEDDSDIRWHYEYLPIDFASTVFTGFFVDRATHIEVFYETTPDQVIEAKQAYAKTMSAVYYSAIIVLSVIVYLFVATVWLDL